MGAGIVHGADWEIAKYRVKKAVEECDKSEIDYLILTGKYEARKKDQKRDGEVALL